MIPSSNIWSNSRCAIWSHSGDRRCALAKIGGPVVVMWCVTLCLITPVVMLGWAGYSEMIASWK